MTGDLKVGILVLLALIALAYMTTRLTRQRFKAADTTTYYTTLVDATGLARESRIRAAGIPVGQVGRMTLSEGKARVELKILTELHVHQDARISLKTFGFLGDKYVSVDPGTESKPLLPEGAQIPGAEEAGDISQLSEQGSELLQKFTRVADNLTVITDRLRRGEGTVGQLLTNPETADRINTTLSGIDRITSGAERIQFSLFGDARSSVLTASGGTRSQFELDLLPGLLNLVRIGVAYRTQGIPPVNPEDNESKVGIDAQFGRRFGPARARVGLFEGTGGAALDVFLWRDRLRLSTEVYRFRTGTEAQLNVDAEILLLPPLYLWSGGEFLLTDSQRSFLIGAGLRLPFLRYP